jgi:hypothetical protein
MGALSATTPTRTGTVTSGAAVAASDTIASTLLGTNGCFLEIITTTSTGAAATAGGGSVTNATSKIFKIFPQQADTSTGNVTVTHSVTSTVTYKLYPLG